MLVGLQGSGKTTTCAKIGYRLTHRDKKKVLMASLDTRRPAAQEQLRVLGEQAGVDTLPIVAGQTPQQIAERAIEAARLGGYDVVLLDTAGPHPHRRGADAEVGARCATSRSRTRPCWSPTASPARTPCKLARSFDERVGITGIVLTRVDGDGRGGAALSMRAVTGKPIKLIGVGEKLGRAGGFPPAAHRRAHPRHGRRGEPGREGGADPRSWRRPRPSRQKMRKGAFDLEDLSDQLKQMEKIGGMSGMMGMLPGIGKVKKQLDAANLDDKLLKRQRAIISSMTPKERRNPKVLDGKRKRRIAAGSGTRPEDVNRLIKMHRQMGDMMKSMGKRGGIMQRLMGGGGGAAPSEAEMERMRAELGRLDPKALEALPKDLKEQLPKGLPAPGAGAGRPLAEAARACQGWAAPCRRGFRACQGCPDCRGRRSSHAAPPHTGAGDGTAASARLARGGSRTVCGILRRRNDGAVPRRAQQPCRRLAAHRRPSRALGAAGLRRLDAGGEDERALARLLRVVEPAWLAGARGDVGPGSGRPRSRLRDGSGAVRPRLRLRTVGMDHAHQLHRTRQCRFPARRRASWRGAGALIRPQRSNTWHLSPSRPIDIATHDSEEET